MSDIKTIMKLIKSRRFSLSDEKKLQAEIEEVFESAGIIHKREFRLDAGSIIDFMVDTTGIEIKIKGSKLSIFRQIERYAQFNQIERLILVTNVPMGMPELVKGKPVYIVNLSRAWL